MSWNTIKKSGAKFLDNNVTDCPKFDIQLRTPVYLGSLWHIENVPGEQSTLSPATEAALLYVINIDQPGVAVEWFICSGIFSQVNAHAVENTSGDDLQMID